MSKTKNRKEYIRKYQREWIAKRKEDFYKDKFCIKCESKNNLQLHHRDPKQKISHNIWSWREDRRLTEIAKCDILCEDCHIDFHAKDRYLGHGHESRYRKGCRCNFCKAAHTKRCREYRKRLQKT